MIRFSCPACGANFTVAAEHAGRKAKCKQCGALLTVPMAQFDPEDLAGLIASGRAPASTASVSGPKAPSESAQPSGDMLDEVTCPGCGMNVSVDRRDSGQMMICSICGEHFNAIDTPQAADTASTVGLTCVPAKVGLYCCDKCGGAFSQTEIMRDAGGTYCKDCFHENLLVHPRAGLRKFGRVMATGSVFVAAALLLLGVCMPVFLGWPSNLPVEDRAPAMTTPKWRVISVSAGSIAPTGDGHFTLVGAPSYYLYVTVRLRVPASREEIRSFRITDARGSPVGSMYSGFLIEGSYHLYFDGGPWELDGHRLHGLGCTVPLHFTEHD